MSDSSEKAVTDHVMRSEHPVTAAAGRWRVTIHVALGLLVSAHLATAMLSDATGDSRTFRASPIRYAIEVAFVGSIMAQPILLAMVAVFWPVPRSMRIIVTIALLMLMLYAWLIGEERRSYAALESTFMPTIAFLVYQVPLRLTRRWRRWRMIPPSSVNPSVRGNQFSMRTLLAVVAVAAVLFALGRVVLPPLMWSSSFGGLTRSVLEAAFGGVVFALFYLPAIPCVPLCLSPRLRIPIVVVALACALIAMMVLFLISAIFDPQGSVPEYATAIVSGVLGALGSISISLLVVRWCGYRLVRERDVRLASADNRTDGSRTAGG